MLDFTLYLTDANNEKGNILISLTLAIAIVTETGGSVLALLQGDFVLCRQAPVNLMHKTHAPIKTF